MTAARFGRTRPWRRGILWLDALVANVDRTWRNPNLLVWHRRLWAIDHGAAMYFHHAWTTKERFALQPYDATDHILRGYAGGIGQADEELAPLVAEELLGEVAGLVPAEWLASDTAHPLPGPSVILSPSILSLPRGGAGPMPGGRRLDASPRSTGRLSPTCDLSPPRPTFTSRPHWPWTCCDVVIVALAWFSPERLRFVGPPTFSAEPVGLPCNVEHFTRATIPARNPPCSVLKVRPDAVTGTLHPFLMEGKHMFETNL